MRERELYKYVKEYFEEKKYRVFIEAPLFSSMRADILALSPIKREIITVEVKLNKFKVALAQAYRRVFFSDYVYLAFPMKYAEYVKRSYKYVLSNACVGIMGIDNNVKVLVRPKRSKFLSL
ncbi:MAG: hypothetical protein DRN04_17960, partial [Thermoprotei archaeon]